MEAKVIVEKPMYTLVSNDYNGEGPEIELYSSDFRNAKIGEEWSSCGSGCCGRDLRAESLRVVYIDNDGVLCLHRIWGTTDSPNPVDWSRQPEAIWFELY